ncbi:hypothetical protein ACFLVN_03305 [Chloroflexota bacterium]
MTTKETFNMILAQQQKWADNNKIELRGENNTTVYSKYLADNLFCTKLSLKTLGEFLSGQGDELKSHMRALYSSSALLVNVFEYWRRVQRVVDIAVACGASQGMTDMVFEKKHKIANLGTPHLDIEFTGESEIPFAVEAKFTEPYQVNVTQRNDTNLDKYLAKEVLWQGISKCKVLAKVIFEEEGKKTSYKYLDTPQLIKHILGLSYRYKSNGFTLLYLWWDCSTNASKGLNDDIQRFSNAIKDEISFKSMTYQELFYNIRNIPGADKSYTDYLGERYFTSESQ